MKGLIAIFAVMVAATAAAQETGKLAIAVVDVQQLVQESAAGKEALTRLKQLQDAKLADEFEGLRKQFAAQRATLTDVKVAELQKQIEDREIQLKRFQADAQQQLEEARRKELEVLEKQIMPVIDEVGREQKLQLIFNKFQSGLVYAEETLDITDQVLRRFNTKVTK